MERVMGSDDAAYFASRAEAERALAESAAHPNAVEAHRRLAASYLQRAQSGVAPPPLADEG